MTEIRPPLDFGSAMMRPSLIWGCATDEHGTRLITDCDEAADSRFRWLHLDLADQRTLGWLENAPGLPDAVHALMISRDTHQQSLVEDGVVGLVLQDFERNFEGGQLFQIGALHIAIAPRLMITGRFHPVYSADLIKQRLRHGIQIGDAEAALGVLLAAISGNLADHVMPLTASIQSAEDEFLSERRTPASRDLIAVRQRVARLGRLITGMRAALLRLEHDPDLPRDLLPPLEWHIQRLGALDADTGAAHGQLRQLRDELDLQAAQRTNQNVYFLSVMSALLLPATLVTGFFGMNTGGMPFADGLAGTAFAAMIAVASSGATWLLLRSRR